jgi:hypothetical protein
MPSKAEIEAAARAMFYDSVGGKFGTHHWPGDEPRPVESSYAEDGAMTLPADHPEAPGRGEAPENCRAAARLALTAAEVGRKEAEKKRADQREERVSALSEMEGLGDGDSIAEMLVELGYDALSDKGVQKRLSIQRRRQREERKSA